MRATLGLVFATTMALVSHQAAAYNCNGLPAYSMGTQYANGNIVKNVNSAYQCKEWGWCSLNSDAYSPGTGWAWTHAWTHIEACDNVTSSSPSSSSTPSSSSSKPSSSSSKSSTSSSKSSSSSSKPSSSSIAPSSSSKSSSVASSSSKSSSSVASSVAGCIAPAYVAGATYTTNQKVSHKGREYSCNIPSWCGMPAAWPDFEPGLENSTSKQTWADLGACGGGSSSSVTPSSSSTSSSSSSSSSSVVVSSSKSSVASSTGNCTIDALPGGGYSMCKSTLDAAEAAKTSSPLFAHVKASIQTRDNSIVDSIVPNDPANPDNVKRVEKIVPESSWIYMFPKANTAYNYTRFLRAVGKFKGFCATYTDGRNSDAICRKSLATMFAHFTQETGGHSSNSDVPEWRQGLYFVREVDCSETGPGCGYNAECSPGNWQAEKWPCGKQANGEFVKYFGRGAKQLSYNYNYGPFSEAMFGDVTVLLNNPDMVAESWLNVASAVFFFVYPQSPKPSMLHVVDGTWIPNADDQAAGIQPGFGATTNIINGGLECGKGVNPKAENRKNYYISFSEYLNSPIPSGENLGCATMQAFPNNSAGAMDVYWEQNWDHNSNNPGGRSFECKLVKYQTAHNALVTGDYQKCVAKHFDVRTIK